MEKTLFDKAVNYLAENLDDISATISKHHESYWLDLKNKMREDYKYQSCQYTNILFLDENNDEVAVFKSEWSIKDVVNNMTSEYGKSYVYDNYYNHAVVDLDSIQPTRMVIEYELDTLSGAIVEIVKIDLINLS